jgi:hypothetical protein
VTAGHAEGEGVAVLVLPDREGGEVDRLGVGGEPRRACVAYLARHVRDGQVITHIAGIHALGSIGAAHYLTEHLAELYTAHPDESFSMAVAAEFDGLAPTSVDVIVPPRAWA